MGYVGAESLSSLLLLPDGMAIEALYPSKTHLTVQVACMLKSASLSPYALTHTRKASVL
jgi:hypothetical protein